MSLIDSIILATAWCPQETFLVRAGRVSARYRVPRKSED